MISIDRKKGKWGNQPVDEHIKKNCTVKGGGAWNGGLRIITVQAYRSDNHQCLPEREKQLSEEVGARFV